MTEHTCLFCKIIAKEIPVTLIAENDLAVAFRDIDPKAPTHVLVVPRRHISSLNDADNAEELGALVMLSAEIARREGIDETGYRSVINTGLDGGQSVFHLHLHLLGGRSMAWPPG